MRQFLFLSILLLFSVCGSSQKACNLNNWSGKYIYKESPVKAIAEYSMVMIWELSIEKNNKKRQAILEVNGQQTYFKFLVEISGTADKIAIIYTKTLDGSYESLYKGDILFILSKNNRNLKTEWKKLEPILAENSPEKCNCFELKKNSSH